MFKIVCWDVLWVIFEERSRLKYVDIIVSRILLRLDFNISSERIGHSLAGGVLVLHKFRLGCLIRWAIDVLIVKFLSLPICRLLLLFICLFVYVCFCQFASLPIGSSTSTYVYIWFKLYFSTLSISSLSLSLCPIFVSHFVV